ncbi:hypothetical protein EZS27_021531 [termite gut metagenome]|uniref:ASCH domain-containing protein n=1 Tax=termite gut metagenome TaxID=433724 RepID=A0A5J4RAE3_9ZZZZ
MFMDAIGWNIKIKFKPNLLKQLFMIVVITLSKTFFTGHSRHCESTMFREKVLEGIKIHTCRQNYEYWKCKIKRLKEVGGVLSIRQWSGKPFYSKQEIITEVPADVVGIQMLSLWKNFEYAVVGCWKVITPVELALNDGLLLEDYQAWFAPVLKKNKEEVIHFALIHFTDFRY